MLADTLLCFIPKAAACHTLKAADASNKHLESAVVVPSHGPWCGHTDVMHRCRAAMQMKDRARAGLGLWLCEPLPPAATAHHPALAPLA